MGVSRFAAPIALPHHRVILMLRLVLICAGLACLLVIVGLPLLAEWAMAHDDDARDYRDSID